MNALSLARDALNDTDDLLRQIRAENMDGSEPVVGEALDRALAARQQLDQTFPVAEQIAQPITALMSVNNPADLDAAPSYVSVTVNNAFIARLRHLQSVCKAFDLERVCVVAYPGEWHYPDGDGEERTETDLLVVTSDGFYFSAEPKHYDQAFESEWQAIDDFVEKALACQQPQLILADDLDGMDPDELAEVLAPESALSASP